MTRRPAWFSFDVLRFPERLVCDAKIVLADGPLAGTKLVGFSLVEGR
jgi:hypothetical protein